MGNSDQDSKQILFWYICSKSWFLNMRRRNAWTQIEMWFQT